MKSTIQRFGSGIHYAMVSEEIVNLFLAINSKRAICTIGGTKFHCAFMVKKEGGYFINVGSKICQEFSLKVGTEIELSFEVDNTEFQFEMPEEFAEVLAEDPDADAIFQNLTDGNKRGLIYLVTLIKSSDKRIERALNIAEKLKFGITSPRLIMK
jgi:Bacteriocin-protection, YdeI or OmpD-Associated/Domain of unknown function (DUF1905)